VIDLVGPRINTTLDAFEVFEALLTKEFKRAQGTDTALAMNVILLVGVQFGEPLL